MTADETSGLPDRLLLDEMFSPRIGQLLGQDGIDCVCVAADRTLTAQDDTTVLDAALQQGRVLVTNNVVDFEPLRRNRIADGRAVPPLIYTDDSAFPRHRQYVGQLAVALADAASNHLAATYGGVLWLSPPQRQ